MSIIRVRKNKNYFTASNEPFVDKRLSWEARGLMGYLLTKPDHWEVRSEALEKEGPAGSRKLKRMLAELRKGKYMNRIRLKRPDGTFDWITEVYESPSQNPRKSSSGAFCTSALSTSAKQHHIVSTDLASTESTTTRARPNIFELYEANIGALTPMIADALTDAEEDFAPQWIEDAIRLAVENNKRNWKYCLAILERWKAEGKDDGKREPKTTRKNGTPAVDALNAYGEANGWN